MTRQEFVNSQPLRAQLHVLVNHDIFKLACSILATEPLTMPKPIPGVDYSAQLAAEGSKRVGYLEFLKDLRAMTNEPRNVKISMPGDEQAFRDVAKQKMIESGIYKEHEVANL